MKRVCGKGVQKKNDEKNLWQTSEGVLDFECRVYKREWFDAACVTAVG
jgi:hypothetical protein